VCHCWLVQQWAPSTRFALLDKPAVAPVQLNSCNSIAPPEASERQKGRRLASHPFGRQLSQHLPQHRSELEAMPREACREDDARVGRMPVNNKVLVGRHRVEAKRMNAAWSFDARQMGVQEFVD